MAHDPFEGEPTLAAEAYAKHRVARIGTRALEEMRELARGAERSGMSQWAEYWRAAVAEAERILGVPNTNRTPHDGGAR